ncbi:MAG: DUF3093 domain-containing protein [Rhodoglobus sp.]
MTNYRERLWPAPWLFIGTALVIPAALLVFLPINQTVGIVVAIVLYAGCVGGLLLGSPVVEVTDTEFRAGRARLPLDVIGATESFRGAEASAERGTRLDARAWLMIRGWVDPVLKLEIVDERDPVPYWIVSSRRPEKVAAAIAQASVKSGS